MLGSLHYYHFQHIFVTKVQSCINILHSIIENDSIDSVFVFWNLFAHAELRQQTEHAKTVFVHLKWELVTSSN